VPDSPGFGVHAIVTRFALPVSFGREAVETEPTDVHLVEAWLETRLRLLRRFCAPSIRRQTTRSFIWLLGIDERLSAQMGKDVASATGGRGSVLRVPPDMAFRDVLRAELAAYGPMILTTRLDSDDALAPDFVESVQRCSRPDRALNFPRGLVYEADLGLTHRVDIASSPFMSFLSTKGLTVHDLGNHRHWSDTVPIVEVGTPQPMWLQLIHDDNALNSRPRHSAMTVGLGPVRRFLEEDAVTRASPPAKLWALLSAVMNRIPSGHLPARWWTRR
jgi:hypothetical protein